MSASNLQEIAPTEVKSGMNIKVHQKIREKNPKGEEKERIQVYEGLVINVRGSKNHKTMTVRKISNGVGVEKIFPLTLPSIAKVELVNQLKTRRKVLNFVRTSKKKLKELKPKVKQAASAPKATTKEETAKTE
ncbi:MAG TPA: 50S ribosomal protein L19 [bacterium]|nr:MAG: 50S ribosomal protein L19 [Parcubacteria group bacterium ADurb.Bin192]HPN14781.1 50S ribosomal protein L19 [bacterium]